ncbi:MAG: SH3 domain-containing protein [Lachnospiraceae bacterium]|nr:SH3 domain-containing protein [Lachnospiraceae bacterium]
MSFKEKAGNFLSKVADPKKYRYYLAALVLIGMVLILVRCTDTTAQDENPMAGAYQAYKQVENKKDSSSQEKALNKLINNYFKFYSKGDVDSLSKLAKPISDKEKSYIKFFSQYVESYENIDIYSKRGLDDKSYLVSATMEIKFKDAETPAPGMEFFYVMTDDNGSLYIANQYSTFNTNNQEEEMDSKVTALIAAFEQQDDVAKLQTKVQQKFNEALLKDEDLNTLLNTTLPDATTSWATDYAKNAGTQSADASDQSDDSKSDDKKDSSNTDSSTDTNTTDQQATNQQTTDQQTTDQQTTDQQTTDQQATDQQAAAQTGPQEITVDGLTEGGTITLTQTVRVRSDMNDQASIVGLGYVSEPMTIGKSYNNGWTQVTTYSGASGYVKTELLH